MEEDMDDFGDIYADAEGCVSTGVSMIPSIRQLYLEDQAMAGVGTGEHGDSEEEERVLYDRIAREGRSDGGPAAAPATAAASRCSDGKPLQGSGDGGHVSVVEESNDSDSDDDLRIVLNEEDCNRFGPPQKAGLGNGAPPAGACAVEDEDDELAVGTRMAHPAKDHKWADLSQLQVDGSQLNGQERCGSSNSGGVVTYSQFKYIRSQSAGYPSNAKAVGQGGVVSFSLPMPSKGDWDVNGSLTTSSCQIGSSEIIRGGFDFHLPNSRMIFDISIESFDKKPWRNQGVDITDFFNFGLNEESWKEYCEKLMVFRKQATLLARNTSYGSKRTNQAFESGFLHGAMSLEAPLNEVAPFEWITATSVVEKPKGKAIQVEGGYSERLPSMDTRRPRHQDADVVIQIPMEVATKDAKPNEKPENIDSSPLRSDNGVYEGPSKRNVVHDSSTLHCHGHDKEETAACDKEEHLESKGTGVREPNVELQILPDSKGTNNKIARKMNDQVLDTVPESTDEILHSSCPSPESISAESSDALSMDRLQSPAKRSSFGSATGSDISDGSSSNISHSERMNGRDNLHDHSFYQEGQGCQPASKLYRDDFYSIYLDREGQNRSNSWRRHHGRLGKGSSCSHLGGEHPSSIGREEVLKRCEDQRCTGKQLSMSSCTQHSCRSDFNHSSSRSSDRRHKCLKRSNFGRKDVKQKECKFTKQYQNVRGNEFSHHKEKYRDTLPDLHFYTQKDWSASRRLRKAYDHHWCVKPDVLTEDRYTKECIEEDDSRKLMYIDRNERGNCDTGIGRYDKDVPYAALDKRKCLQKREKCRQNFCDVSQGYGEDDDKLWRYSNYKFLDDDTFRGSHSINRRAWHESNHQGIHRHNSQILSERYVDHHRSFGARDAEIKKNEGWDFLDTQLTDDYLSSYRDHHGFDGGYYSTKEWDGHPENTLFNERKKYIQVSQRRHTNVDQVSLGQQIPDDIPYVEARFSCERIYGHKNSCDNSKSPVSLKFSQSRFSVNENKIEVLRKTCSKTKEQEYMNHRDAVSGCLYDYEGKIFERYGEVVYKKKIRDDKVKNFDHVDEIGWGKGSPGKRLKMEVNNTQENFSGSEKAKQHNYENYANHSDVEPEEPGVVHDRDASGLEEGQLVEDEDADTATLTERWESGKTVPILSSEARNAHDKKKGQSKDTSNKKKTTEYDESQILETLAKMEKRRERFKEPIVPKKEQGNASNTGSQILLVTDEVKTERPARKRRWGNPTS